MMTAFDEEKSKSPINNGKISQVYKFLTFVNKSIRKMLKNIYGQYYFIYSRKCFQASITL